MTWNEEEARRWKSGEFKEKTQEKRPDVYLYYSFDEGEGSAYRGPRVHIRIVPCETPCFPHGLCLAESFTGPNAVEEAEKLAVKVQEYVDLIKKMS